MRQSDVGVPHFKVPFQFGGLNGGALMNEQDTSEDVSDCVKTFLAYPVEFRDDLPDFGTPDMVFRMVTTTPIIDRIAGLLKDWEPRADILTDEDRSDIENFTRHFILNLRSQEA